MTGSVFTSVKTEGGLLPVDLLRGVSLLDRDLPGLRGEDYGLAPGERLPDAIVRSWNRLLPVWERFAEKLAALPASETSAQTQTRDQWTKWLLDELGFHRLEAANPVVIDDKPYPVSHRSEGVALHLVGARVDIEHRAQLGGRAPHSMVQEFLNRDDDYLWALVCNGLHLRILRDSSSLTRQAYCDFDLDAIFSGQLYADFALCWLVCHVTRFKPPIETGGDDGSKACWLEQWSDTAKTEGVRVLDELRRGVEAAIEALGSGLLTPANLVLRERIRDGELTTQEFQRQLLRLVYRLLFLLVAESRDLLNDPDAPDEARARYRDSYSINRLVELARRQRGSLHTDLWAGLQIVFTALAGPGTPSLGLVGLGSFLWSPASIPDIAEAVIPNRQLLQAVEKLTMFESGGVLRRVDYKNLGAEELGSVYESLLETHAEVDLTSQAVNLSTAAGNERKTTGSYYTPSSLIRVLLDSALDPVLDEAEQADEPEAALLALNVLDPAAGSGHFLIAAASRIAHRVASVRSGDVEPSPTELRHALRDVISHCLYGIDVNPLSVELCKVSLWMEAMEPGKPLSFLDHRIVCGNSLLGTTPALIEAGLPDEAFKSLTGDDKTVVTSMKKRNKAERDGQGGLGFGSDSADDAKAIADAIEALDALPSDTPEQIAAKEQRYDALRSGAEAERLELAANAWCAGFVSEKTKTSVQITTDVVRRCAEDLSRVTEDERRYIDELAAHYKFLHLHVVFPDVFHMPTAGASPENEKCGWSGGFDVVLGNPPWDQIQYDPRETFALTHSDIAEATTTAKRNRLIAALEVDEPAVYHRYLRDMRSLDGVKHFAHASNRFPLGSVGRLNTAPLFVELMWDCIGGRGRVGVVSPTGIATDSFTQEFFRAMVERRSLVSLFDFENRRKIFPAVDSRMKFCLLALTGDLRPAPDAQLVFFALGVDEIEDTSRRFTLSIDDFALLNPNTRTCPIFRSKRDAEITKGIYRRMPVLLKEGVSDGNPWGFKGQLMFMMNTDSHLFRTRQDLESEGWKLNGNQFAKGQQRFVPLYEAKMVSFFDHRAADIVISESAAIRQGQPEYLSDDEHNEPDRLVIPRNWISKMEVDARTTSAARARIAMCDITSATNWRTFVSTIVPAAGFGNNLPILEVQANPVTVMALNAALSTFVFDYVARQKVGGVHLNFYVVNQLPVPTVAQLESIEQQLCVRALELTYTAWDLSEFAHQLGYACPPYRWDPDRRDLLRAEIDAIAFHLYGIDRDDVDYILETFPIVKRKDEAEFGEYRTKSLILERYDAMAKADAEGVEYETALDPPPADPSLCHPESTRPDWAQPAR